MAGVTFECSLIFFLGGGVFESVLISTKFFRKFDRESKTAITLSEHVETCLFFFFPILYIDHTGQSYYVHLN